MSQEPHDEKNAEAEHSETKDSHEEEENPESEGKQTETRESELEESVSSEEVSILNDPNFLNELLSNVQEQSDIEVTAAETEVRADLPKDFVIYNNIKESENRDIYKPTNGYLTNNNGNNGRYEERQDGEYSTHNDWFVKDE